MTPTDTQVGDQWGAVLDPHQRKAVEHAAMDAGAYSWRNCRLAMVEDGKVIGYPVFSRADMAELARLYREEPAPPAASVSPGTSNASEPIPVALNSKTTVQVAAIIADRDGRDFADVMREASEPKPSQHPIRGDGELLPCPFCGSGEAAHKDDLTGVWVEQNDHDDTAYWAECWACRSRSDEFQSRSDAIAAWNRRAHPPTSYGKGESIDLMTVKAAFLWGYAKGSGGGLSAGEDEWSVYAQALQSIGGRTE